MPDRQAIVAAIRAILPSYIEESIIDKMNEAVTAIAAGIRMPDGQISPPLPDLYDYDTVTTSLTAAYVSLPSDYQRNVFAIVDSSGYRVNSPSGGGYYSFQKFLEQASNQLLTEAGSVYMVCVRGTRLYYQGIPTAATTYGVHFYRKPTDMANDTAEPDGLPEHLALPLVKHWVCKELFSDAVEDGQDNVGTGTNLHTAKFYQAMTDLMDFVGVDAVPMYYGGGDSEDRAVCD
jgi:hypothetical protein